MNKIPYLALLCRAGQHSALQTPGKDPSDPPGTTSLIDQRKSMPKFGCAHWRGACYPMAWYSDLDSKLYLLEFTTGAVSSPQADRTVIISHAVGGAHYGHQAISLNAAADMYRLSIDCCLTKTM